MQLKLAQIRRSRGMTRKDLALAGRLLNLSGEERPFNE